MNVGSNVDRGFCEKDSRAEEQMERDLCLNKWRVFKGFKMADESMMEKYDK